MHFMGQIFRSDLIGQMVIFFIILKMYRDCFGVFYFYFFVFVFQWRGLRLTGSHIAKVDLELKVLLSLPECWNYKCTPPSFI